MRAVLVLLLLCESRQAETAVSRSLLYLARHQSEDGSWGRVLKSCRCRPLLPLETPLPIPVDATVERRFNELIEQLADDEIRIRERAQRELEGLGARAVPLLQKNLRHPDPEVAFRCREALTALWKGRFDLRTLGLEVGRIADEDFQTMSTGLALLCFLGAGYAHYSKDQFSDFQGKTFDYGAVVRKASGWLLSKQGGDGSLAPGDPVTHAIATAAMSEHYGMTAAQALKEPAARAAAYLKTLQSSDPTFLLWKGIALHSAHLSELPECGGEACERMAELLERTPSPMTLSGALLMRSCRKQRAEPLRKRFSDLELKALSPLDAWMVTSAVIQCGTEGSVKTWSDSLWKEIPKVQAGRHCESGSWSLNGENREESLISTLYTTLTMERSYRYSCALFNTPWGK